MKIQTFFLPLSLLAITSSTTVRADVASRAELLDAVARETSVAADEALREDGGDPAELMRPERPFGGDAELRNDFAYQSNAELSGAGGEGDFVWFPSVAGNVSYQISERAALEGRAALQAGFYADLTELDFWGVNAEALTRYQLGSGWSAYGGAEAYDYQSVNSSDDLSSALAPTAGLSYSRYYAASRTHAYANIGLRHLYTDPSADERDEVSLTLGVTREIAARLFAQGVYQYRFADYEEAGRRDERHYVGVNLVYVFCDTLQASAGVVFVDNQSTLAAAEYQTINTGLSSSLSWKF